MVGRRVIIVVVLAITGMLAAGPARAGGGVWLVNGERPDLAVMVPGEEVTASSSVYLPSVRPNARGYHAGPDQGPFFVYIVEPDGYAPPLPSGAMRVGRVVFSPTDEPEVLDVTVTFRVPDLEPGRYGLAHCNDPCTRQIGDIMTTDLLVIDGDDVGYVAGRMSRLDAAFDRHRFWAHDRIGDLKATLERHSTRIDALESQVAKLERTSRSLLGEGREDRATPLSNGLLPAALLLFLLLAIWTRSRLMIPVDVSPPPSSPVPSRS